MFGHKLAVKYKSQLNKMLDLLKASPNLFSGQERVFMLISQEVDRLKAFQPGEETKRIEVTKLYRRLDESRKSLALGGIKNDHPVMSQINLLIKFIEKANNII